MRFCLVLLGAAAFAFSAQAQTTVQHGLRVPNGFEVVEYADSKLANDIFHLTIDPKGRVVVSGAGYIRVLVDEKNEGKATKAIEILSGPKDGAQGMLWEGDWLYYVGDNGLRRVKIVDDKPAGPPELIRAIKTGNEHAAHAIRRGPDGWLYLLTGDGAATDKSYATLKTSPIKEPVGGVVLRFSPDLKDSEIVAHGFRNPYDMDFNVAGDLFTYDSDNERCVSLPWYAPTRFYHVIPGGNYGWLAREHGAFMRLPSSLPDVVPPKVELGRGSPTACICYRHVQFPPRFRGNFFLADWTFGRIYRISDAEGWTKEVFAEAVGEEGFAPSAMAVHPTTGELFISIGGRGTRGGVYRMRYAPGKPIDPAALAEMRPKPRSLDWKPADKRPKDIATLVQILRHVEGFKSEEMEQVVQGAITGPWDQTNRITVDLIRAARVDESKVLDFFRSQNDHRRLAWAQGAFCLAKAADDPTVVKKCCALLAEGEKYGEGRMYWRALQIALGDICAPQARGTVWEGYSLRRPTPNQEHVALILKAARAEPFTMEAGRLLAMLEDDDPEVLGKIAGGLAGQSPVTDFHNLIVLARLKAPRSQVVTKQIAAVLLDLDRKVIQKGLHRDSHWPLRLAEVHAELAKKDPNLNAAMLAHEAFGRQDHALFAQCPDFDKRAAAKVFLAQAAKYPDFEWNADIVRLMGELPAEQSFPVLRKLWGQAGLEEAIVPVLAAHPDAADRDRFLYGLNSPQMATVRVSLDALEKLPEKGVDENHVLSLILSLRRLGDTKDEKALSERLGKYLERLTGQKHAADKKAWADWFAAAHPKLAARLSGPDGVDVAAWSKRLAKIDWATGDAERGKAVFTRANCASCHSGERALGPDLRGITGRFSRDDVLTAILQPSKDISNRYRTTLLETAEGKVYQGLVIYEAVDSMILQTGPAAVVRLVNKQVVGKRLTDVSLMPAGLLDMAKDEEIADLYAYLKSLGGSEKK